MGIILMIIEIILIFCIYVTRKLYKNGDTMLLTNDSKFIEELPEDKKGEFIQRSRAIALKLFYCLLIVPPFIYVLYICNFNNIAMIIFTLILVGCILMYSLNKMVQLQNDFHPHQ